MNIQNLRTMPDVGCARGQAHSGTQWCAEAVEMGKELDALNAALDGVEKEIQNSACWIINGAFESGYAQAKQEAIDIIKKARREKMSTIEYLFAVVTVYAVAVTILLVVSRRQISWLRMDIEQEQVWVQEFRDQAKKWQQHCCQRKAEIAAILEKL